MNPLSKKMFAIKDRATDSFNVPFTVMTTAQAVRTFADEVNSDPQRSAIAKHPDDYDMYIVGEYDDQTAKITPLDPIERIARAKDLLRGE